jgi:ABC-2 type transport system ATP-binding protein
MSVLNWSGVLSPAAARRAPGEPAEDLVLDVRDLRMRYGRTDVLCGVSFGARRGEVLALLGPNGAGKTTTIEILEGFRMRSSGRVSVLGTGRSCSAGWPGASPGRAWPRAARRPCST